jgi:hypothetical protein
MTVGRLRHEIGVGELVGWATFINERAEATSPSTTTAAPPPPLQWRRGRPRGVDIMSADPARAIAALTGGG